MKRKENAERELFEKNLEGYETVSSGEYAKTLSVYTDKNGDKAIIPPGYTVSGLKQENTIWGVNDGLVIYQIPPEKRQITGVSYNRWSEKQPWNFINILAKSIWEDKKAVNSLKKNCNQFVWVPVGLLEKKLIMGKDLKAQFGRDSAEYGVREFKYLYVDPIPKSQVESVKKYGGFFISRYDISHREGSNVPLSVKGQLPWTNINFYNARAVATELANGNGVMSHLVYGAEQDTVIAWFYQTDFQRSFDEFINVTKWGNYGKYNENLDLVQEYLFVTGKYDKYRRHNLYDFAGNVTEWTQEKGRQGGRLSGEYDGYVIRDHYRRGPGSPSTRYAERPTVEKLTLGFRAALYIK